MQIQALLKKTFGNHLFFTNVGISFGLSGIGDLIEQKIEKRQQTQQASGNLVKKVSSVNWSRTLHMSTAFGLTSGFLCHFWYNYLDKVLPGRGVRVIVQKIAWDQVKKIIFVINCPLSEKLEPRKRKQHNKRIILLLLEVQLAKICTIH